MTFISANRRLSRLGRARCLMIPRLAAGQRVSLHLVLGVDANAPPGTLANIADVTPGVDPPGPPIARPDLPRPPAAPGSGVLPLRRARALVRVLAKRARHVRQPRFTG
jgi:hypothetical protein